MFVRQLMTTNPRTCHIGGHLDLVAKIMWDADCGAVPIVDETNRVLGIVTDRDVCMAAYLQGRPLAELPIEATMSKQVIFCKPDDDVASAEAKMRTAQIRRLPVIASDGSLIGILSLNDLAREAAGNGVHQGAPRSSDVTETLASICAPRQAMMSVPS